MNVVLDFGRDGDGLDTLRRAVDFARELRSAGFQVRVSGSLTVDARWARVTMPTVAELAPTPTPTPKHRAARKADSA